MRFTDAMNKQVRRPSKETPGIVPQVPPFAKRKGARGDAPPFHKRRPSDSRPAVRVHTGHPPLTSLRSFAPPYAPSRRGRALSPCAAVNPCVPLSFRAKRGISVCA